MLPQSPWLGIFTFCFQPSVSPSSLCLTDFQPPLFLTADQQNSHLSRQHGPEYTDLGFILAAGCGKQQQANQKGTPITCGGSFLPTGSDLLIPACKVIFTQREAFPLFCVICSFHHQGIVFPPTADMIAFSSRYTHPVFFKSLVLFTADVSVKSSGFQAAADLWHTPGKTFLQLRRAQTRPYCRKPEQKQSNRDYILP